ncbi:MAG: choice-of-anchor B family protein [Bacteroidota bacterium]
MTRFLTLLTLFSVASLSSGCDTLQQVLAEVQEGLEPAVPTSPSLGVTECEDGTAGPYACDRVDLVSRVSIAELGSSSGNDIWGWTDGLTGTEYALVGLDDGTAFVSLANPESPAVLGKLPTHTSSSNWRDVKVYRDHAFIVSEAGGHGMQVFDLTRLRGLSENAARTFSDDAHYSGVGSAHNIVINEDSGFAYIVGSSPEAGKPAECASKGLHAVDIRQPTRPRFSTCFSDAAQDVAPRSAPGYTHDAQCVDYSGPDRSYRGRELCFAANEDVLTIFDVEDKRNVRIVSMAQYPGHAYSHQGWLTEDQRFFLLDDELDEMNGITSTQRTLVFDLADLDNPEFAYAWDSGLTVIDHNQYIHRGYSFQSNYRAGLRIIDVSRVASGDLEEVAYFDTYPQGENVAFGGQWSNYPYFSSGLVIANDKKNGLFVLRPRLSPFSSRF